MLCKTREEAQVRMMSLMKPSLANVSRDMALQRIMPGTAQAVGNVGKSVLSSVTSRI